MPSLIILGNINQYTFANTLVSANLKSLQIFGNTLNNIFVIHSEESYKYLIQQEKSLDWVKHVNKFNLLENQFIHKTLILNNEEANVKLFVEYLEFIIKGLGSKDELLIDLTNGTAIHKNILSTISYVLDIKHQYMIDIQYLLSNKVSLTSFIETDNILRGAYIHTPNNKTIDNVAYLDLSKVSRYKEVIEEQTREFQHITQGNNDGEFFKKNLETSIKLKLQSNISNDNALHRIVTSAISASAEELLGVLINLLNVSVPSRLTLGQKMDFLKNNAQFPASFDLEFLESFNKFVLYLRNSATHKLGKLDDIEKFKSELALNIMFPFLDFYTKIVYPAIFGNNNNQTIQPLQTNVLECLHENTTYYYAIDGDNTGQILENLFVTADNELNIKSRSKGIKDAISDIIKDIKTNVGRDAIIFEAGDDILFKGYCSIERLKEYQKIYKNKTNGLTCSIGVGQSLLNVFFALKLAKAQPLKNAIKIVGTID